MVNRGKTTTFGQLVEVGTSGAKINPSTIEGSTR